jgi:tRNA pseudouridine38-40 synthase
MPENHLALALNACLPPDIRVHEAVPAPPGFHARFDATGKQYRYHVWNHPAMNPLLRHQAWHVPEALDLSRMRDAAGRLTGHHDFRAFTSNRGHPLENSYRLLSRCEIRRSGPHLTIILEADGFLYKMCRGIVGTLVGIGRGDSQVADVGSLLENPDRRLAGMNAPAHGLVLWKVSYGEKDGRARLAGP